MRFSWLIFTLICCKIGQMRRKIHPMFMIVAFLGLTMLLFLASRTTPSDMTPMTTSSQETTNSTSTKEAASQIPITITDAMTMKPIIDVSGWQRPSEIDYDVLAKQISGVIVRVQSGSHTKEENNASDKNGLDKAYQTHIEEFQKRGIPVAVYAYVTGNSLKSMKKEAETFYQAAHSYNPTFYWLDVEEKTMEDMDAGVEAFRSRLAELGADNIGIYVGTYFMDEHSIRTNKFDAVWIPTYGHNTGYYDAAPNTDIDYDLHQYTDKGKLQGFPHHLDLNLITTQKEPNAVYAKLFTVPTE